MPIFKVNKEKEGSFQVLSSVEAIRQKVSLYLASKGSLGIFNGFREIVDNALDMYNEGKNDFLAVSINTDGSITVRDHGFGISAKPLEKTGKPIIQEAFTSLHAGGKFKDGLYKKGTRGTHGLGSKATNALSTSFEVWSYCNKKWSYIAFEKGIVTKKVKEVEKPPIKQDKGTIIKFTPDYSCFDAGSKLSVKAVREFLELQSYLCKGIKIELKTIKNEYTFYQKDGILALLNKQIEAIEATKLGKPFLFETDDLQVTLCWATTSDEKSMSFASGTRTKEGGTHVDGLYKALNAAIKPYKGKKEFTPSDLRQGLFSILNLSVIEPQFSSQSKERLTSNHALDEVYDTVKPELDKYFKSNQAMVKRIIDQAVEVSKMMNKLKMDKKNLLEMKKSSKSRLPAKLAACRTKDRTKIELFLVEGESASGTAKEARDDNYQAVLELRGKLINAYTSKPDKLMANTEIQDMLSYLGYGGDTTTGTDIDKVIFLTDPDIDALHIEVLIASALKKIMPKVLEQGKVYLIRTPLYNCQYRGKRYFAADQESLLAQIGGKMPEGGIQRVKGLGELNADKLADIAFEQSTRKLVRVVDSTGTDEKEYIKIVGKASDTRKELLGFEGT